MTKAKNLEAAAQTDEFSDSNTIFIYVLANMCGDNANTHFL